ncbi:MAG: ELM1/GtrOC1 family putative glycosyltransferase [Labrys sp. (in: a-proteobacteria)]|jgi:mitochondrial fission protein ELM1
MQPPCHVLLLSDGRPGHYRQSEAIVQALGRSRSVTVDRIDLTFRPFIRKSLIPRLARVLPPRLFLRLVHGSDPSRIRKPDLIVSAGGTTIGANAALACLLGSANVFCGSMRGLDSEAFSLILLPYPSAAGLKRVAVLPKPTKLDPDTLPVPRPLSTNADLDGARACILIGGPTPTAAFGARDWDDLARLITMLSRDHHMAVTVVTSRRTPVEAYAVLDRLRGSDETLLTLVDHRAGSGGTIEEAIGAADLVFVTADSMSMMTEAALSRRPAIALYPRERQSHRDDEAVDDLRHRGLLATTALDAIEGVDLTALIGGLSPMRTNHLDDLATVVLDAIARQDGKR